MKISILILSSVIILTVLFVLPNQASANSSFSNYYWVKTYGGQDNDVILDMKVLQDGSIIAVGYTNSTGAGGTDALVMKISPRGKVEWAKTYGGPNNDEATSVAVTSSGNIVVAGWTESYGAGKTDIWVLRLDKQGNIIWQKTYGGSNYEGYPGLNYGRISVAIMQNGSIIIAGWSDSFSAGGHGVGPIHWGEKSHNLWVLCLAPNGNVTWQKAYGGSNTDKPQAVAVTPEGNIVIAGWTYSFGAGKDDVWVLKLWYNGSVLWQRTYGGIGYDWANAVAIAPNGDIIVAGGTNSFGAGQDDAWILKLDSSGQVVWQKTLGGILNDTATALTIRPNGDIIVAGWTNSFGNGMSDVWLISLNNEGNIIWQRTYGGIGYDWANAVAIAPNGDIIVAGGTNSFGAGQDDAWILHLPPDGKINDSKLCINSNSMINVPVISVKESKVDISNTHAKVSESYVYPNAWNPLTKTQYGPRTLKVTSNPSGAKVYLNDVYIGLTPLDILLNPGSYKVEIIKNGYEEYNKIVNVTIEQNPTISAELIRIPSKTNSMTTQTPMTSKANSESSLTQTRSQTSPKASNIGRIAFAGIAIIVIVAIILFGGITKVKYSRRFPGVLSPLINRTQRLRNSKTLSTKFPSELCGKYEPLEFLGEGGFARVFKVKRKKDGKIVAVKIPRIDERTSDLFVKEVAAWYNLNHENIVRLYKADILPVPHLEMEFVEGVKVNGKPVRDLEAYLKPVDEKTALKLIRSIAEGLKHAHSKGIYHLDLKPGNVLLKPDLTPKITDWGLAKISARSSLSKHYGYSPLYAAPEQLDEETHGEPDHRTDIYQLGLIFYELLTGELPYKAISKDALALKITSEKFKPKPISEFKPELKKFDGLFEKLLAKRKEDRYQSIDEFLSALEFLGKLEREKKELSNTRLAMKQSRSKEEIKRLGVENVRKTVKIALLSARLNDKAELLAALDSLKPYTKENLDDLLRAIEQVELLLKEGVPINTKVEEKIEALVKRIEEEVMRSKMI